LTNHTVLVGYGRVGRLVADGLKAAGTPFLVIEDQGDRLEELKRLGLEAVNANAASAPAITAANVAGARRIILAIPDGFEASNVLKKARQLNPGIEIVARAHSDAEVEHLRQSGANFIIMGEREVARGMLAHVLETSQNDIAAAAAAEQAVEGGNRADPSVPLPSGPSVEAASGLAEPAAAAQKETL
ncbi:NAD-binding protein, partial [Xanthobacter autotrophicus]|uniref:NAD-binding protein n=1 Tax=Xanthobacter autotrophicus TaxID=280 RepID=UPI001E456EB1